jgi:hypothetical protein
MNDPLAWVPATVTSAVLLAFCWSAPLLAVEDNSPQRSETLRKYRIDPAAPLESRIGEVPTAFVKLFTDDGEPAPTNHVLTAVERRKVAAAFAALTPLHRRILRDRLRSVSFADGMPHTALTSTINPNEPYEVFDLTVRAGVLNEDISHLLTDKERTCFETAGSSLSVSIEGGALDAIVYVLLHEATHMVDGSLGLASGPGSGKPQDGPQAGSFAEGVWTTRITPAPPYRNALLASIKFRPDGKIMNVGQAKALYTALSRTPFVSLYGSSNWHDDLAESVAWYHLTRKLEQPYRIEIRDQGKIIGSTRIGVGGLGAIAR